MFSIRKETLERLRKEYPVGCRVELTKMNDPYRTDLVPGCKGTVRCVDDMGTIHVSWDIGSSLGVVYGEDSCRRLDSVKVICYGEERVWDSRKEAILYYSKTAANSEGSELERYAKIAIQLAQGRTICNGDDEE